LAHEDVVAFLARHSGVMITSHVEPDGDSLGSCLGLKQALGGLEREADVVIESPVPAALRFLPGAEAVRRGADAPRSKRYGAAFVLDCSSLDRAGPSVTALLQPGAEICNIDHHIGNDGFGTVRLVNPEASATAELVFEVLEAANIALTPQVAECLYVGILSDTGAFRYQNTTPRALRLAARLVEHGAPAAQVAEALYAKKSASSLRLLGLALASLEARNLGRVSALTITRDMFERARANPEDADGIVQYAKSLDGTRVGVLIQEVAPQEVRVSLRSDGTVDVNEVAGRFGGGGHRTAAGARIRGALDPVRREVLDAVDQAMNGGPNPPGR
jgi:bifunctional oligoribonuclease and PAP phosphatase NrnA